MEDDLSEEEKHLWGQFLEMMTRRGFNYMDVKTELKDPNVVEAVTFSKSESYIEKISTIE